MPDIEITIGSRKFEVACQAGEEQFLRAAAKMIDDEASVLEKHINNLTESRMLLMSGLMLADKVSGIDEKTKASEQKIAELEAEIDALKTAGPQMVEVPVIPASVTDTLAEIAARAEAIAAEVEGKATEEGTSQ
jgi:cell division protein ZapA